MIMEPCTDDLVGAIPYHNVYSSLSRMNARYRVRISGEYLLDHTTQAASEEAPPKTQL